MSIAKLPTLSRTQVAEIYRQLDEQYGIAPLQTLENVGRNLALLTRSMLDGDLVDRPLVILAGRGCNGAGGLVAARHLLNWGAWVQVICTHPADQVAGITAQELHILQAMGAPLAWAEEGWELPPSDLVIDAVIGVGLEGEPQGKARELIQLANSSAAPILSLEVPSGVNLDASQRVTPCVGAAATMTLALPKQGMLEEDVRKACGHLYLCDIGVPLALYEELGFAVPVIFARDPIVRWDVVDGSARVVEPA